MGGIWIEYNVLNFLFKAQLKKRTGGGETRGREEPEEDKGREEKESQNEEAAPSPSQRSRSTRSAAHLAGAARVLPPLGGTDAGWEKNMTAHLKKNNRNDEKIISNLVCILVMTLLWPVILCHSVSSPLPLGWKNWSLRSAWVSMTARLSQTQVSKMEEVIIEIPKTQILWNIIKYEFKKV